MKFRKSPHQTEKALRHAQKPANPRSTNPIGSKSTYFEPKKWSPYGNPPQGPKNDAGEALPGHSGPLLRLAKVTQKRGFSRRFPGGFRAVFRQVRRRFSGGFPAAQQRFCQRFPNGFPAAQQQFCQWSPAVFQRFSGSSTPVFQRFSNGFTDCFPTIFRRFSAGFPAVLPVVSGSFPAVLPTVFQRFCRRFSYGSTPVFR